MIAGLLFNSIEKQAKPVVAFDPKRCLRARLNGNACQRCVAACKKAALTLRDGGIVFKEDKCTACLACASGCPNDAFDYAFDPASLLAALEGGENAGPLILTCGKWSLDRRFAMPCIGLLSEPVLAVMHLLARREFYLDLHRCPDCGNSEVLALFHERLQGLIQATETPAGPRIRFIDNNHPGPGAGNDRRFFLRKATNSLIDLSRKASSAFSPAADQETGKGGQGKNASLTNKLLQEALGRLPQHAGQERRLLYSYHYTLTANGNCDRCPACTGMCPTGALKRRQEKDVKRLYFISARCSGCGLCVEFCKKAALTLRPGAEADPRVAVAIA